MTIADSHAPTETEPLCAVLLTTQQRRLLKACVAWRARVHTDAEQRSLVCCADCGTPGFYGPGRCEGGRACPRP